MAAARDIVILGGGTAGWMCAAGLSPLLATGQWRVRVVEADDIPAIGVGEASLPHIKDFHDRLGLDEADFMRATKASFKLGIAFTGWSGGADSYMHPFGAFGRDWAGVGFHHYLHRAETLGHAAGDLQAYCLPVQAARAGRFDLPSAEAGSLTSQYAYAYHFDASLYAGWLRAIAIKRGVVRQEGHVTGVMRDADSGDVTALILRSGESVAADLFVDASGFAAELIGKAFDTPWEDWSAWLPCDRAWAMPGALEGDNPPPFTEAVACEAGWQWRIPLQGRMGHGYVFSSAFIHDEQALDSLMASVNQPLAAPRLMHFRTGRRIEAWRGNCVALGLASGFLEPLESTSLYLSQIAVSRLLDCLSAPVDPRLRDTFNLYMDNEYDRVRDFLILHYHANGRHGEALWDHTRAMPIPDSLAAKLALFRAGGHLPSYREGLFSQQSWLAVLNGQGVRAQAHDRMADAVPADMLVDKLDELRRRVVRHAAAMPLHFEALKTRGAVMAEALS